MIQPAAIAGLRRPRFDTVAVEAMNCYNTTETRSVSLIRYMRGLSGPLTRPRVLALGGIVPSSRIPVDVLYPSLSA